MHILLEKHFLNDVKGGNSQTTFRQDRWRKEKGLEFGIRVGFKSQLFQEWLKVI